MFTSRYEKGETIYDILHRIKHLEDVLGIADGSSNILTTQLTSIQTLRLSYIPTNYILFSDHTNKVCGKPMSDVIFPNINQTTVTDIGNNKISIGTVQDIDITSNPKFNNLTLNNALQIVPSNYLNSPTYAFELLKETQQDSTFTINKINNSIVGPTILLQKSRNTLFDPTSVEQNDSLGVIYFSSYDGNNWITPALITSKVDSHGTTLEIQTTPNGSNIPQSAITIDQEGITHIYSTIQSTNYSTGALITDGGIGIAGDLYVEGNLSLGGSIDVDKLTLSGTIDSTSGSTGSLTVGGGVGIAKDVYIGGSHVILNTIGSSSISTGSVILNGGMSVSKDLFVAGSLSDPINLSSANPYYLTGTLNSTSISTGTFVVNGGIGVANNFYVGGNLYFDNETLDTLHIYSTQDTTSTSTGALILYGGAGINKSMSVGDNITMGKNNTDWGDTYIKMPINRVGTYSYMFTQPNYIAMSYNGYYDSSSTYIHNNPAMIASILACTNETIDMKIARISTEIPRDMLTLYSDGLMRLYYANTNYDNTIYTDFKVDSDGHLSIKPKNQQILIGNSATDRYQIRFPSSPGTYSYIYTVTPGVSLSYNGMWNEGWQLQNMGHRSSVIQVEATGTVNHYISYNNGDQPQYTMRVINDGSIELYHHATTWINTKGTLRTNPDYSLSIYATGNQCNLGVNDTDYCRLRFPCGNMTGTGTAPYGYLYSWDGGISMTYNGYWNGANWICDSGRTPLSIDCIDGEIDFNVATENGLRPRKILTNDYNGHNKLYYQNPTWSDNTIYTDIYCDSGGNLFVEPTGGLIDINQGNPVIFQKTSSTNLTVSGGSSIAKNVIIGTNNLGFNRLSIDGNSGNVFVPSSLPYPNITTSVNHSIVLWTNTSSSNDAYAIMDLYDTLGGGKGLRIGGNITDVRILGIFESYVAGGGTAITQKYDDSNYATHSISANGEYTINASGDVVNFMDTVRTATSSYPSVIIDGGASIHRIPFIGAITSGTYIPYYAYNTTADIFQNITLWSETATTTKYFNIYAKRDFSFGISNAVDTMFGDRTVIEGQINVSGSTNMLTMADWYLVTYAPYDVSGPWSAIVSVRSTFGRLTELIVNPHIGFYSREIDYDINMSCQIAVSNRYANTYNVGSDVANTSVSINGDYLLKQSFVMPGTSDDYNYVSEIDFFCSRWGMGMDSNRQGTYSVPPFNVYIAEGTYDNYVVINRTSVDALDGIGYVRIRAIFPTAVQLRGGVTYQIMFGYGYVLNVGCTTIPGADTLYVYQASTGNVLQPAKVMCFKLYYSNTVLNYNILVKPVGQCSGCEVRCSDSRMIIAPLDTKTDTIYGTLLYDSKNPPIDGRIRTHTQNIFITSTIESTSTSTGSLIVSGGLGVGNNLSIGGVCKIWGTTGSAGISTGILNVLGGINIAKQINTNGFMTVGPVDIYGYLQVTSDWSKIGQIRYSSVDGLIFGPTTAGQVYFDAPLQLEVLNTTEATSLSTGALIAKGGVGIGKRYITGSSGAQIDSSSTSTGTLVVSGGVGIAKDLYVGTDIYVSGKSTMDQFRYSKISEVYRGNCFNFTDVTLVGAETAGFHAICYSPQLGLYIAGSYTNYIICTSYDGLNWTVQNIDTIGVYVTWVSELSLFLLCGGTTNTFKMSRDGFNWYTVYSSGVGYDWRCICWSKKQGKLVVVNAGATNPTVAISTNGIDWTFNNGLSSVYRWWGICYSEYLNLYAAVSLQLPTASKVSLSSDAITWTQYDFPTYAFSICWSPELKIFVAGGSQQMSYSRDGINWTIRSTPTHYVQWRKVDWIPDYHLFIGAGYGGSTLGDVCYSYDGVTWYDANLSNASSMYALGCCYSSTLRQIAFTRYGSVSIITPTYEKTIYPQTVESTSPSTGGVVTYGGVGVAKNLYVGGTTSIGSNYTAINGSIFYCTFSTTANAEIATLPIGTLLNGATITGGKLDLTGGTTFKRVDFDAIKNLSLLGQTGTIKFLYTPNYSGNPATNQDMIYIQTPSINHNTIRIQQKPNGKIYVGLYDYTGTYISVPNSEIASWSPVNGTEYEFCLCFDCNNASSTKLYINGKQLGKELSTLGTRYPHATTITIGGPWYSANYYMRNLSIYPTVLYPITYTPPDGAFFYASLTNSFDAEVAVNPTATTYGTIAINNSRLNLINSADGYIEYNAGTNLAGLGQRGTIKWNFIPNYTGSPATTQRFFTIHKIPAPSYINSIHFYLFTNSSLSFTMICNNFTVYNTYSFGTFSIQPNQEYEMCFCYDCDNFWNTRLYINGVQFGNTLNLGGQSMKPISYDRFWIAKKAAGEISNFSLRNFAIFPTVLYSPNLYQNTTPTFYASFASSIDADIATLPTGTGVGSPTIVNEKLELIGDKLVYYNGATNLISVGPVCTIQFLYTPNYSGQPTESQRIFNIAGPAYQNRIALWGNAYPSGAAIYLSVYDYTGAELTIYNVNNFFMWSGTAGTEYTMTIYLNCLNPNSTRIFVNNALRLTVNTQGTRTNSVSNIIIGSDTTSINPAWTPNFSIRNFRIYNDCYFPPKYAIPQNSEVFTASYSNTINADKAVLPTGTPIGSPQIVNNRLDLSDGTLKHVLYDGPTNFATLGQAGTIKFYYTPNYSGIPTKLQFPVSLHRTSDEFSRSQITLYHINGSGYLALSVWDDNQVVLGRTEAQWLPTAGIEYEIYLCFDCNNSNNNRIFINGTQLGSAVGVPGYRTSASSLTFRVGYDGNAWTRGLSVYNTVLCTSNYIPNHLMPYTLNTSNALTTLGGAGIGNNIYTNNNLNLGTNALACTSLVLGNNTINNHTVGTLSGNWTGPVTIASTIKYERLGNYVKICSCIVPATATSTAIFTFSATLPSGIYNTASSITIPIYVQNGNYMHGTLYIDTSGNVQVWAGQLSTNTFTNTNTVMFQVNGTYRV